MKMVLIAYNEALDEEVMTAMETAGLENYTKWTKVHGKGAASGPHLATHVWPKSNNVVAVVTEEDRVAALLVEIRSLRATLGHEGIKAFILPIDEITE